MPAQPPITKFARIMLTMGSGESPWLIVAFLFGAVFLGVLSNFVFTLLTDPATLTSADIVRVVVASLALLACAYAAYRRDLHLAWRPIDINPAFTEQHAPRSAGLIWLLSLGKLDLPLFAIRYHTACFDRPSTCHCWLLLTPEVQEKKLFAALQARVEELGFQVQLHPVLLTAETTEAAHEAIAGIYEKGRTDSGLSPENIVTDITGGNKPMTAGAVLACAPRGWPLEYIVTERDPVTGQFVDGTQQAVRVQVRWDVRAA